MKKKLAVLLAALLPVAAFLAACGSGAATGDDAGVSGETFNTGKFSVLVPEGWNAFEVSDMWSDEEGAVDASSLNVYKGAESEIDMFLKCGMSIKYYDGSETYIDTRSMYDETSDISPVTAGNNTWTGYKASMKLTETSSYQYTILKMGEDEENPNFIVTVLEENDGETISVEDEDVKAILASIKAN